MSIIGGQPSPGAVAGDGSAALLDRIEWSASLSVTAYDVSISVRTNDPRIAEGLAGHLPPGSTRTALFDTDRVYSLVVEEDRAGRDQHLMYVNDALVARRSTLQAGLRAFEADVQLYVAEMAPERVFVHAGVVAYQGRAIMLPGRSFAGKSTLVRELVRAGAQYYSDEYAVLDSAGAVHPYPRPISIRNERNPGAPKHHPVDAVSAYAGEGPLPVGLVVMSEFRAGGQWRPRRLSPGRGALAMLANTVAARRIPEVALATLHQVVTRAPIVASERGEAASVVGPILGLAAQA